MSTIDDLVLARKLIGFARAGVMPSEALVSRASGAIGRTEQAPRLAHSKRLLDYMAGRVLPSVANCTIGMNEIDAVLLPLRQDWRDQQAREVQAARARSSAERG